MSKGYPRFDSSESDEDEVWLFDFVVSVCEASPILEIVDQPPDQVAPFVFVVVARLGITPIDLSRDHRLDIDWLDLPHGSHRHHGPDQLRRP